MKLAIVAADIPHTNGLTFNEVARALKIFVESDSFLGMEITEFNADKDRDHRLATKLTAFITSTFKFVFNTNTFKYPTIKIKLDQPPMYQP